MATSLGEKLRTAREAQGIPLREVADQTRIAAHYLNAIEADDYKILPGGIFNKGFIKSFAKYVGVDENEALSDYARFMAESGLTAEEANQTPRQREVMIGDESSSSIVTVVLALLILGVLAGGVYFAVQYFRNPDQIAATATPTPTPNNSASNSNAATITNTATTPAVIPSVADGLKVELKVSEDVSFDITLDGKKQTPLLKVGESKTVAAQQSIRIRYAKVKAPMIQMTLNGQPAIVSSTPKVPNGNGVEFEITKENFAQYLQSNVQPTPPTQ